MQRKDIAVQKLYFTGTILQGSNPGPSSHYKPPLIFYVFTLSNGTRLLYYGSVIVEEHYSVVEYFAIVNSNTRLKGHLYEKIVGNPNIGWL